MSRAYEVLESELVHDQVEALRELGTVAVVALNGPNPDAEHGVLSEDTLARNRHAGALAIAGGFNLLFVGGEADLNRDWTREQYGQRLEKLRPFSDASSHDTIGNAISARRYVDAAGIDSVGPVTLNYHAPRANYVFGKVMEPSRPIVVCPPEESPYGHAKGAYLRAAQIPIGVLNRWQLRGFDVEADDALKVLEARLQTTHRYGGESKALGGLTVRLLDRLTSGGKSKA